MAYVLWRVLTKKYAKVRLGLASLPVIPAERRAAGDKEETWTLASDVPFLETQVKPQPDENQETHHDDPKDDEEFVDASDLSRCQEGRKSRAKKVKNYLKKCKGALSSAREDSATRCSNSSNTTTTSSSKKQTRGRQKRHSTSSSWYLDDSTTIENDGNQSKETAVVQIKENLPTRTTSLTREYDDSMGKTSPRRFGSENLLDSTDRVIGDKRDDGNICKDDAEDNRQIDDEVKGVVPVACTITGNRCDVATLVRNLLGPIYGEEVLDQLTRQARDILVCAYHGNLECFVESYLSPASILLTQVKKSVAETDDESLPDGWPLTLSGKGLVLQLGELESSALRHGECYLCVRKTAAAATASALDSGKNEEEESINDFVEIALVWRTSMLSVGILNWDDEFINPDKIDSTSKSIENTLASKFEPKHVFSDDFNKLTCPKLPTMRLDQRQTGRRKEEARMKIEDLKKPNCLESMINGFKSSTTDVSDEDSPEELANLIGTLLVTVERKIERVSIDDIIFPCPACRNIDTDDPLLGCKCSSNIDDISGHKTDNCECGNVMEKSKTFEVAGIKHIDSDDEEEVRMGFGAKKLEEVSSPRSIHDLPERVLHCGLRLPGYADDASGRLVLEFENETPGSEKICPREIASYLLYLARLHSSDRTKNGWTLVIRGGNEEDLETLDRALVLVQGRVHVRLALLLRNNQDQSVESQFPRSHVKISSVDDATVNRRFPRRRDGVFNQEQWIAFYKEYDSIMSEWQATGRRLVLEMSELKDSTNVGASLTPLSHLLTESSSSRITRQASDALASLDERAVPLSHLEYTVSAVKRARRLMEEVGNAATRLESSFESRRATIRNLAVLRTIEEQAREVLSWLCKKGEDVLAKHARHAATTLTAARLHERDFEKFYFASMRHLDKGSDLAEAAGTSGLDELAKSLREHLRDFGSRLDDRREYLEDTSRCYLLLDRSQEWAAEAKNAIARGNTKFYTQALVPLAVEHFTEMMGLAEKLGSETLIEQCRNVRIKCAEIVELTRTNERTGESPSTRRRSFATSESAAESNSWDDSDSNTGSCTIDSPPGTSGGSRPILDNIAELGESGGGGGGQDQQLLETPPRSPARSPGGGRRLGKPPVNSHLQRSPSIAPAGMKAKKTILLIMREMIQTERDYVKSLEYIIENYIPELVREDIPQAMRGQRNVIFGNVEKIYEFHSQHFLRELEQCEHCPMMVGQCFLRHENKFYLYALYNKNKPNSDSLMAEYGTTFFKTKQLELGDKMDLASYLLKPVQRMGKYALLLQQLVKAGTDLSEQLAGKNEKRTKDDEEEEGDNDVKPIVEGEAELRAAEQMVRFQLRHGNDLLAMDSLRDCDVNVKEQGRLLRQNEFLVWQGKGKKCLRQVFLFEDLILFSKARRFPDRKNLDIYIYKHSIKTTDIGLTAVMADSPTKFEIWFRKRKPGDTYTLQCASEEIKKAWTEELSNLLWKQALRNREVRLAEMSSMGIGNKPCLDIRPSADQINDRSISVAQLSKTPRFRNSIAVSVSDDSSRCTRRPHSVISVSSSSSSGGSSGGPPTALHLGLEASPRLHHRSTTLNSQCSVESGIIADISITSDDGVDSGDRSHWKSSLESPTSSNPPTTSTPLQSPTSSHAPPVPATSSSSTDVNLTPYDQDMSINL